MFIVFGRLSVPPYWKYKFCLALVTLQIELTEAIRKKVALLLIRKD
jgi:hypothetical protein